MIIIDLERSQEYRPHRFVSTCSPCLWIALALAGFASTPLHASTVSLSADKTLPQVDFAVSELHRAMAYLGKYYAHKIRGATELALYRNDRREENRSSAVAEMTQAASYWDLYTSTALKQYHNPVDLNRVIVVDWQALRKEVERDIAIAGEDLSRQTTPN